MPAATCYSEGPSEIPGFHPISIFYTLLWRSSNQTYISTYLPCLGSIWYMRALFTLLSVFWLRENISFKLRIERLTCKQTCCPSPSGPVGWVPARRGRPEEPPGDRAPSRQGSTRSSTSTKCGLASHLPRPGSSCCSTGGLNVCREVRSWPSLKTALSSVLVTLGECTRRAIHWNIS